MRRSLVTAAVAAAAAASVAVASGWAATILGTPGADRLSGTPRGDTIDGLAGDDVLAGASGDDLLRGGPGRDTLLGGPGADRVVAHSDGARDTVRCGPGTDVVNADREDAVAADCEVVARRLSSDTTRALGAAHATAVEPDSFAWGATVVSAFQVGRFRDGGAAAIGFAVTSDGGTTWRSGLVPGLTSSSPRPGPDARVSDPVVGYDALHGVWLVSSLGISPTSFAILVSRSTDGSDWSGTTVAAQGPRGALDKEWIACDNWPSSPFRGRCYLAYLDVAARRVLTRFSTDGGLSWSEGVATSSAVEPGFEMNGAQPLPRPDGSLVVVATTLSEQESATGEHALLAARSADGGASFASEVEIARTATVSVDGLRAPPLPSADVDASGRLYVAWHGCPSAPGCLLDRVLLATSADGLTWSPPAPVPAAPPGAHEFLPGLAVDQAAPVGAPARLAIVYATLPGTCGAPATCPGVDVWLATSKDGAAAWSRQRLSAEPARLGWLVRAGGTFLGDYLSTSFAGGRPVAVFTLAAAPARGALREAVFALARYR